MHQAAEQGLIWHTLRTCLLLEQIQIAFAQFKLAGGDQVFVDLHFVRHRDDQCIGVIRRQGPAKCRLRERRAAAFIGPHVV